MKLSYTYDSPVGMLYLAEENGVLTDLRFRPIPIAEERETPLLSRAAEQLDEYFDGRRHEFDLPLYPRGTPFQTSVWSALQDIPYGETRSYKNIASALGKPTACRAVGSANNKNPISIIIPCHRVIGSGGALTGYGGGLDVKQALLELEKR
ncbi:MAG: methylated-DNA--[protein]-cysteine S-methyltransferase [Clostridiales bacterium]|nr:methylated-DNA--[protein]-cysteine S-methyltransferase [Clostridiales bacterium]